MMRIIGVVVAAVAAVAGTVVPAHAEDGWVTDGEGNLYALDTVTANASPVGSAAHGVTALAAFGTSTMLGVQDGTGAEQHLVNVNLATAATADRGLLDSSDIWVSLTVSADGTVYAAAAGNQDVPLFTVDPDDGAMTPLGEAQPGVHFSAAAGACGGTLLAADDGGHLVRVDRATGVPVVLGQMSTGSDSVYALAFDHRHRTLWAMTRGTSGEHLYQVDPATGAVTPTPYASGQIGAGAIGLAFDSPSACRYERTLSLGYSRTKHRFSGRLTSSWQPCTSGQKVSIYRKVKGPDDKLGTVTTSATGRYALVKGLRHGSAYAVASRSSKPTTGVCLPDTSALVH